jgi:hypothetical protein
VHNGSEHRRGPAELLVVVLPRAGSAVGALVDPALVARLASQHRALSDIPYSPRHLYPLG